MADRRRHRGPHPKDRELFSDAVLPFLRRAVSDLGWLLERGYASNAALALVGDHLGLTARQRMAVRRCACSDAQREKRLARAVAPRDLPGCTVWIDGFNVLTSVEAALAGGVLLVGRDGALRDVASVHGSYRTVEETPRALEAIAEVLEAQGVTKCRWLLDAPVSNSGRLKARILEFAGTRGLCWSVELVDDPDRVLAAAPDDVVVSSADSIVMNAAARNWQLAREVVEGIRPRPRILDLREHEHESP